MLPKGRGTSVEVSRNWETEESLPQAGKTARGQAESRGAFQELRVGSGWLESGVCL